MMSLPISLKQYFPQNQVRSIYSVFHKTSWKKWQAGGNPFPKITFSLRVNARHFCAVKLMARMPPAGHTCRRAGTVHSSCLCVPIMAEGKTLGVLHLQGQGFSVFKRRLATAIAEQASFALCNFKLEEILSSESIHDPLTGLFNRFYLEKSLELEIERSKSGASPVGVIILHIDDMKQFNETRGNETGDMILRELAAVLQRNIRSGDTVGRYELRKFGIVLSEISPDDVQRRARFLCQKMRHIQMSHSGRTSGGISLSSGTAIFPDGGTTAAALLGAADAALQKEATDTQSDDS
jgi:diguanylate cyclase (GGDEF)-like protein